MAAKKTSPKAPVSSVRAYAESPAPEGIRVDPGTVQTEWLKHLEPDAPQPVFSTKALAHGREMLAAKGLVEGFSTNPQMDLLWAAGFPQVAFIMDGLPKDDTREALLALHNRPGERKKMWRSVQLELGRVYSRRGAFARVFECNPDGDTVLELDAEDEYLAATSNRSLTDDDLERVYCQSEDPSGDALLLEALEGPDRAAFAAVRVLEEGLPTESGAFQVISAIVPLVSRLRSETAVKLAAQVEASLFGSADESVAKAARELSLAVEVRRDLAAYCERFFAPAVVDAWDNKADMNDAYVRTFSSIRSAAMLPGLLLVGARKEAKDKVANWLAARGPERAQDLTELAANADAQVARLAKQALKLF